MQYYYYYYFFFISRINSVLNYEQSFADSFLFTSHSRQALGQACQTALLNPFATRLTNNGEIDVAIIVFSIYYITDYWGNVLIKLLNDYISNYCPNPSSPYKELLRQHSFEDNTHS